jgi:hypothetical protein
MFIGSDELNIHLLWIQREEIQASHAVYAISKFLISSYFSEQSETLQSWILYMCIYEFSVSADVSFTYVTHIVMKLLNISLSKVL